MVEVCCTHLSASALGPERKTMAMGFPISPQCSFGDQKVEVLLLTKDALMLPGMLVQLEY